MLFRGGIALFRRLEKWTKPRYAPFVEQEGFRRFHALMMIAAAILLMLPLPVPFSNTLPAYAISFMSLGYLQRDGAMMLVSYGFSLLTIAYFTAIAVLGVEGFQWLALADWRPWS